MKQVLTIEEMNHLTSLGLDTSDASMYWEIPLESGYCDYDGYHSTDPNDEASLTVYKTNIDDFAYIPAFILQDILRHLPVYIYDKQYKLVIKPDFHKDKWCIGYHEFSGDRCFLMNAYYEETIDNLIDAAYNLLVYCLENTNEIKTE